MTYWWSSWRYGPCGRLARGAGAVLCLLSIASCGELTRQGRASSFLVIERLEAASGAEPARFATVLQSDVLTVVDGTPTFFEDPGQVTFRLALKDPGSSSTPSAPTTNNFITVTRYRVVFTRSDGRNTPGVDVPFGFDGGVTLTVGGSVTTASFALVRAQAKLEAPLRALRDLGGAVVLSTIAEVTFFGHDQTGSEVSVTGTISVNFADWGDPS